MTDPIITAFPTPLKKGAPLLTNEEKKKIIAEKFKDILETLGLDLENESLAKTPMRMARMYVDEIFSGLNPETFPKIEFYHQNIPAKEMIIIKNISLISFCEHHLVPMVGTAHIAYLPTSNKIIGLSKINRLVRFFAKRPQLQERLTAQIADSLSSLLETKDVAVTLLAKHFCVSARGIEDSDSFAQTNFFSGCFEDNFRYREEFFSSLPKEHTFEHHNGSTD